MSEPTLPPGWDNSQAPTDREAAPGQREGLPTPEIQPTEEEQAREEAAARLRSEAARQLGRVGGPARMRGMTTQEKTLLGRKAAERRWARHRLRAKHAAARARAARNLGR